MFISNAVQKIIQTNKNDKLAGHVQIKQAKNSFTSVQHFKWNAQQTARPHCFADFATPEKSSASFRFLVF